MNVSIVLLSGEPLELTVEPTESVQKLQRRVQDLVPRWCRARLVLGDQVLSSTSTLAESGVEDGALITLIAIPRSFLVLTCSEDSTAKLWSIDTGMCIQTFAGHTAAVCSAVFSGDGASVLTSSDDSTLRIRRKRGGCEC